MRTQEIGKRLSRPGPKRMLALDGGGVRGALSIGFLSRIEKLLAQRSVDPERFRLCDYFDLIGGTSTGAVLATLLALGYKVDETKPLYLQLASRVFKRSFWRRGLLISKFGDAALMKRIRAAVGDLELGSSELRTGLAIVTKRLDTGSPWVVTNNPSGKFYHDPPDGSFIGNHRYPLASLIRASTAAPHYFAPEELEIVEGEPPGLFVDGGVSPYNSPSLLLLELAGMSGYGFNWQLGPENLLLISVGAGTFRRRISAKAARRMPAIVFTARSLSGLINDTQAQALALLQWLSQSDTAWVVNREIGDLNGERPMETALLTFQRYDARLESEWLERLTGNKIDEAQLERYQELDDPSMIPDLERIGELAAERQIRDEHFPTSFD